MMRHGRSLSYWLMYAYYLPSVLIMWAEWDRAGAATGWCAIGGSALATFAGACFKKAVRVRADRKQSIGVAVVGLCLGFFAVWLSENYVAPLLGYVTLPGLVWSLIGFVVALLAAPPDFASQRLAARRQ